MTELRKAAEEALEALEEHWEEHEAIDALRQALAQTEQKKEWVGLTEDEVWELVNQSLSKKWGFLDEQAFAKAIEAKLKEKNT
jgi:lipoate-protein ligase A